jgi:sulfate permease, SulP family
MINKNSFTNLASGLVSALVLIAYSGSFSILIAGGKLSSYTGSTMLATLISGCVTVVLLSYLSSFYFMLGGPDSNPSAILAFNLAAISANFSANFEYNTSGMFATIMMYLFLSAFLCGVVIYSIGILNWGKYFRAIPYQVIGGFMGGTGCILLLGGWKMLVGVNLNQTTFANLQNVSSISWLFTIGVALILVILTRISKHPAVVPLVLLFSSIIFNIVLHISNISRETATLNNLLVSKLHINSWTNPLNINFKLVRWDYLISHWVDFFALCFVVIISTIMNASSLELVAKKDADLDAELRAIGIANFLNGILGGIVSVNSFNRSVLNLKSGATSRWSARISIFVVLLIVLFVPKLITYLPTPVLTAIIIYLGISLLLQWLIDSRTKMPISDYLILLLIAITIACIGIVAGVLIGILVSAASFIISLMRSPVIRSRFNGSNRKSNVERSSTELELLSLNANLIHGVAIQGTLFFGTVTNLYDEFKDIAEPNKMFIIDLFNCTDIDISSVNVIRKLIQLCNTKSSNLIITGASQKLLDKMTRCGLTIKDNRLFIFNDLDHGLEYAENEILNSQNVSVNPVTLFTGFNLSDAQTLIKYFTHLSVKAGEVFINKDDNSDSLYFVLKGKVTVYMKKVGDVNIHRLRTYMPGAILGEMGFYSHQLRSASIVADTDSELLTINLQSAEKLESEKPALASRLQRLVIMTLAMRLRQANESSA